MKDKENEATRPPSTLLPTFRVELVALGLEPAQGGGLVARRDLELLDLALVIGLEAVADRRRDFGGHGGGGGRGEGEFFLFVLASKRSMPENGSERFFSSLSHFFFSTASSFSRGLFRLSFSSPPLCTDFSEHRADAPLLPPWLTGNQQRAERGSVDTPEKGRRERESKERTPVPKKEKKEKKREAMPLRQRPKKRPAAPPRRGDGAAADEDDIDERHEQEQVRLSR